MKTYISFITFVVSRLNSLALNHILKEGIRKYGGQVLASSFLVYDAKETTTDS